MLRLSGCLLVGLLALRPATAQTHYRTGANAAVESESGIALLRSSPSDVMEASVLSSESVELGNASRSSDFAAAPSRGMVVADQRTATGLRVGAFAAAVFRTLATQNSIALNSISQNGVSHEMDAVLRPPGVGPGETSLFGEAKRLYDSATSYRTERAVVSVDPLNLQWRLRVRLDQ